MPESVRLKSFELFPEDIGSVDLNLLHALSTSVGWPHRLKDWELLRQVGQGIAAVDGIGRVFGSAMWFPSGPDFATIGLVIVLPRTQAQGTARWLMEQVFAACGARHLSLNATRDAYGLYHALGFVKEGVVELYQGDVPDLPPVLPPLRGQLCAFSPAMIEDIITLDTAAFGVDRGAIIRRLAEDASIGVLLREGAIAGYSMCREFGRGHVIGPLVASHDEDAIHLAAMHLPALRGRFVRVDTRSKGPFRDFLRSNGLALAETVTTMSKGRALLNRGVGEPDIFALAGHALG